MKKTFKITSPKIKTARVVEAVKFQIKKYFKRERNKPLPEGVDFWDFDCKFADKEENACVVQSSEINSLISAAEAQGLESFYVEIMAKPGIRLKQEKEQKVDDFLEESSE